MNKLTSTYQVAVAEQLGLTNMHQVPSITQVTVNVGVGKHRDDKAYIEAVRHDLALITGQSPHERRARLAIAGFNVRQGNLVGFRVTLRGKRRDDFVQRFVTTTLPRVRDFRGLRLSSLDGHGNLSVGLTEQLSFPEIQADEIDVIFGLQVTFTTSAHDNAQAEILFRALGFPLMTRGSETADSDAGLDIRQGKKEVKS